MTGEKLLIVEDEALLAELYARTLRADGFDVATAPDADAARGLLAVTPPQLILLDLGLPGLDGLSFAREILSTSTPGIIVVSARAAPEDRVTALEIGCDDFLVKPVHLGELTARVRAVLRRQARRSRIRVGPLVLDTKARTLDGPEGTIALTRGEFTTLSMLVAHQGEAVEREAMCRQVSRNPEESDLRTVDALIRRIRRKIEPYVDDAIVTLPGIGYRLGVTTEPA